MRIFAENATQAEVISYLVQKYNTASEFEDTTTFNYATAYPVGALVDLNFIPYSATATYAVNALTTINGLSYICTTSITGEAFNPAHWTLIGNQYDLYYVTSPYPEFQIAKPYCVNDKVFWNGKVYTCIQNSIILTHEDEIQFGQYANIPEINVFPDDKVNGALFWGIGTVYTVPAGTLPSDATKWTQGDNRSQQILMYMIDMVIYHIHRRIAQRAIPTFRVDAYNAAINWLEMAAQGTYITADIPKLQPVQGKRIRWGGNVKNINSY